MFFFCFSRTILNVNICTHLDIFRLSADRNGVKICRNSPFNTHGSIFFFSERINNRNRRLLETVMVVLESDLDLP